jgi:hypothetical protein
MISSTEGWILGADGIYQLHIKDETSNISIEYILIIVAIIGVLFGWLFIRKKT